jgi:hypothetical protein
VNIQEEQKRESESHSPDEGDDVQSRRVIRVAKELHKRVDNISSDFGELHGTDVNRLYQQLAVFWSLDDVKPVRAESLN